MIITETLRLATSQYIYADSPITAITMLATTNGELKFVGDTD